MIDKRLLHAVRESKKYIMGNVLVQWISLLSNVCMIFSISILLQKLYLQETNITAFVIPATAIMISILVRFVCIMLGAKFSFLSSKAVKKNLRQRIYKKLLNIGSSYYEKTSTSEIVQVSVEGVDQLETYFAAYLPQLFYSVLAPLTLFLILSFINLPSAFVLFLCVPLIPIAIAAVQTFAKKLLAKYWGQYTTLGDTFLENLQGLTTLKIYEADEYKNEKMNRESEKFRKITMKVLTMQLNSVTIMDVIAYGGAALGITMSVTQFAAGNISLGGCIAILLLSADFFIPMRLLGSFFHIAMNGLAASNKIFKLLDLPEEESPVQVDFPDKCGIHCSNVSFSYDESRQILQNVTLDLRQTGLVSIVGESGCGKSTLAAILTGKSKGYKGEIHLAEVSLSQIYAESLRKNITYIGFDSYLFKGTIRDNLLMGNPHASEEQMWRALQKVHLSKFLKSADGLDVTLSERATNLSGGQRQRLALARAILHDSPVYIFDEATCNIDVESENDILAQIYELAKTKSVLLITHRLANAKHSDCIYTMQNGKIVEFGSHNELLNKKGVYAQMWNTQYELEHYTKEAS